MKIELHIHYPGLTQAEQTRILEAIRVAVQHAAVCAACGCVKDGTAENDFEGDFIRSQHLDVSTSAEIDPVPGPSDPVAVLSAPVQRYRHVEGRTGSAVTVSWPPLQLSGVRRQEPG